MEKSILGKGLPSGMFTRAVLACGAQLVEIDDRAEQQVGSR